MRLERRDRPGSRDREVAGAEYGDARYTVDLDRHVVANPSLGSCVTYLEVVISACWNGRSPCLSQRPRAP